MDAGSKMRFASVRGPGNDRELAAYLPGNYEIYGHRFPDGPEGRCVYLIRGTDVAGWTLDDYVIPRLASGSMWAEEVDGTPWDDDSVQFPRLLAEIREIVAWKESDYERLAESMDLTPEDIDELFERALVAWDKAKARARG